MIFKTSNKTEPQCYELSLFGADVVARDEVLSLEPGDKLFLLNVERNVLSGVFEASTKGAHRILPDAWDGRYPYQVKVIQPPDVHNIGRAKEILDSLNLRSHRILQDFEADTLTSLVTSNGVKPPFESNGHTTLSSEATSSPALAKAVKQISKARRERGIAESGDERPSPESTTLWDYPKQSYGRKPKGNNKYAGVTPAFIIYNLIKRYTEPGDLVIDPMCGSGTTIDVCEEEGRKVIGFDVVPTRPDVIENDARVIPLLNESVDMVFIDSPYGDNIKYNESPRSIGKLSAETEEFYDELEKVMAEAYRVLKPGKVLGWLIGDQWVQKRFTPVGFKIYERLIKYFEPVDIISVTRRSQTSNTGMWHNRALKFNFYLRGFKYLHIMRKPLLGQPSSKNRPVKWASYERD